jgi:hypothetical protein
VKRIGIISVAIVALVGISFVVGRWLNNDTVERGKVVELLRAQERGDAAAMEHDLTDCRDAGCQAIVRANAARLRGHGELKIPLYESQTAHALRSRTKFTRVVWFTTGRLTTVQCVLVRRTGNVLSGMAVTLLRVTAPIGREASCPT